MATLSGICGLTLLLIAFGLGNLRQYNQDLLLLYNPLNFVGALLLAIYAFSSMNWIFIILEGIWAIYALVNIVTALLHQYRRLSQPPAVNKIGRLQTDS